MQLHKQPLTSQLMQTVKRSNYTISLYKGKKSVIAGSHFPWKSVPSTVLSLHYDGIFYITLFFPFIERKTSKSEHFFLSQNQLVTPSIYVTVTLS